MLRLNNISEKENEKVIKDDNIFVGGGDVLY